MKFILTFVVSICSLTLFSQTTNKNVKPFLDIIVSQFPNVRDIAINSTNDEAIFTAQSVMGDISALISVKKVNGQWVNPKVISFSGRYFDLEPFLSKDGLTLYFVSNRPFDQTSSTTKDFDIWFSQRHSLKEEWSTPINMGPIVNTKMDEFYPSITDSKNLYFTMDNPELNQKDDIYISKFINGTYTSPEPLGVDVNSNGYEFNAYVASDESYIIYSCYNREDGLGSGDLYISTKSENGEWTPSKNMGDQINSNKMDYCPFVNESSKMLYYTSKRNALNPTFESKVNLNDLLETFNSDENGSSRLYQVSLLEFLTSKED